MTDPLLIGIKNGEMKAFNSLYQKYYKPLCYIGIHLLGNIELAEEVTDDVMIYIWHHRQDIETDSLKKYLAVAVHRRSLNVLRSTSYRNGQHSVSITAENIGWYFSSLFDSTHPLEQLMVQEMEQRVSDTVDSMPELTKKIFLLSRHENKKYDEIAQECGVSVPTVKYHMKKALQILSDTLGELVILLLFTQGIS